MANANKNNNQNSNLDIEITEEVIEGVFSNLVVISHSPTEFILDFVLNLPAMPKGRVKSRVILTPEHAKRLMLALENNLDNFEHQFGLIDESPVRGEGSSGNTSPTFNPPAGIA